MARVSRTAMLYAAMIGGNSNFGLLKPGDRFRFVTDPRARVWRKLRGNWYASADPAGGAGVKYRTGSGTAVLTVEGS